MQVGHVFDWNGQGQMGQLGVGARLGSACRAAREQAELKAIEVAQAAGVSEATISRFERGRWPLNVERIVGAYEGMARLPLDELWRRAIDPPGEDSTR